MLNPLVSLLGKIVAHGARKPGTDGQTDRPSTVILAVHAHRGLIMNKTPYSAIVYHIYDATHRDLNFGFLVHYAAIVHAVHLRNIPK